MYVKLFSQILDSSIWLETGDTRIVWITLLAAMDVDGFARFATVENLARRANVSTDACQIAVNVLESPDPNSSDDANEGRRIERVPGGWLVLNCSKYRELERELNRRERVKGYVAKHRAKQKTKDVITSNQDVINSNQDVRKCKRMQKQKQKKRENKNIFSEAEKILESSKPTTSSDVDVVFDYWRSTLKHPDAKLTPKRRAKILGRFKEGYTVDDLRRAVDGCAQSAFHQGVNDNAKVYDDLELICRSGEKVEQFKTYSEQGDTNGTIIRRHASRVESKSERNWRETNELCQTLEADEIDSTLALIPRLSASHGY